MRTYWHFFMLVCFFHSVAQAQTPGTARSNERDILRLDLNAGLSSPSPGVMGGASALWTKWPAHSLGVETNLLYNEVVGDDSHLVTQSFDAVWEYSWALFSGFHALRLRGGLGASKVRRHWNKPEDYGQTANQNRSIWATHCAASLAFDFPIADLMWLRAGFRSEKAFLKGVPLQTSLFAGWVLGGQWIGIGD